MTWRPVNGVGFQYHANGQPASGYYLKFYQSGTTTPTNMATDDTGGTTLDKCQINSEGYPINGSSAVFIPYIDQKYRAVLYLNSTDADANTFANAAWDIDAINFGAQLLDDLADTTDVAKGDALVGVKRNETNAEASTIHVYNQTRKALMGVDYGPSLSLTNGTDDWTTVIQNALDDLTAGDTVEFPNGIFSYTTLTNPNLVSMEGRGISTTFRGAFANADWGSPYTKLNGTILRCSATSGNSIQISDAVTNRYGGELMSNMLILGPGSGTGIGLDLQNIISGTFNNVAVANFPTGIKLAATSEDLGFYNCKAWGNTLGLHLANSAVKQNSFYQFESNANATGIQIDNDSGLAVFYGGLIQGSTTDGITIDGISHVILDGMWFEDSTITGDTIRVEGTTPLFINIRNCRFSSGCAGINLATGQAIHLENIKGFSLPVTVGAGVVRSLFVNAGSDTGLTITDNSAQGITYLNNDVLICKQFGSRSGTTGSIAAAGAETIFTPEDGATYLLSVIVTTNSAAYFWTGTVSGHAGTGLNIGVIDNALVTMINSSGALQVQNDDGSAHAYNWSAVRIK